MNSIMLSKVQSSAVLGVEGIPVIVEVDISNGLPSFTTVGLPDGPVRESKDRVKAAIKNSGYPFPTKKITVNLAPADLKKEGTLFDLPIAIGLLVASEILSQASINNFIIIGELSLDGSIRPVSGVLPIVLGAVSLGIKNIIVPEGNGCEAALVKDINVLAVKTLYETVEVLKGLRSLSFYSTTEKEETRQKYPVGFEDIKGQENIKRALEIAASGQHNVLLKGPPGTGKTMIARSIPSILPDFSHEERVQTSKIYSVVGLNGKNNNLLVKERPFRAPHHTISDAGLVGGGTIPRPGEVSLAHNGVLFLDELPEFKKNVLEVLRQPLEDGLITISRAQKSLTFPAQFMLIAAMNPCPCGYFGSKKHECHCNELQIRRYQSKISGPLLDRIDMHVEVNGIDFEDLQSLPAKDTSEEIRKRVNRTREIQNERFNMDTTLKANGQMGPKDIELNCRIGHDSKQLLKKSIDKLGLSARAYHRILKLARTIADMEESNQISFSHVAEAIQFRRGSFES